jgi:hypothetical protein
MSTFEDNNARLGLPLPGRPLFDRCDTLALGKMIKTVSSSAPIYMK